MLKLTDITVQFGTEPILHNLSVAISDRERAAVVGRNGAGKSTLLKVAGGLLAPDSGEVSLGRGQEAGLLQQEQHVRAGVTLWQEALGAFEHVLELERRAQKLLEQAAAHEGDALMALLEEADHLQERFRHAEGHRAEAVCGRVLSGLGFTEEDWGKEATSFSGGWRIRVALARLLLRRPAFLLLDEPTNHLDMETRTWLLHELKRYPGGVVVISHDRDFLDRLVTRTLDVAEGTVMSYTGGFTAWRKARAARIEQLIKESAERAEERARIEAFIRRFRAKASKAAQVQARVKALEKLPPIAVPSSAKRARLTFQDPPPAQDPMLLLKDVGKRYGDLTVLRDVNRDVYAGNRILLVGPNGAGKSTLLKMMAGRLPPSSGSVRPGAGCKVAWFAQDQADELPEDQTVLDVVMAADPLQSPGRIRALLGSLLFEGEDVHKTCGVLSGGEKSRVALARILLTRANLLLLDEPTNHLDVETQEVLADALRRFTGAVVFVSHDRTFSSELADMVWAVGGGQVDRHPGGLEEFLWARAIELGVVAARAPNESAPDTWLLGALPLHDRVEGAAGATAGTDTSDDDEGGQGKDAWADRKAQQREADRKRKRVAEIEDEIAEGEEAQATLNEQLASPSMAEDWEQLSALTSTWQKGQKRLEALYAEWEELHEE